MVRAQEESHDEDREQRAERIALLRKTIAEGRYRVSAYDVAKAMMRRLGERPDAWRSDG